MKKMQWRSKDGPREWSLYTQHLEKRAFLAQKLDIPEPVAQILINRGINTVEEGEVFLKPVLSRLYSPFCMKDMDLAVDLILKALEGHKKIAVYGDYDADGITATALLVSLLQDLGGDVTLYIPSRFAEGYGLHRDALDRLKEQGVSLVITVDCGITSVEEVSYARQLEMEIIVTDHHQPQDVLPAAGAVINPQRSDCSYPFKALCGVGIAYKLGEALLRKLAAGTEKKIEEYLDLVAIGTVADVVPLLGENRILVCQGLRRMSRNLRPGLQALCRVAGLRSEKITARQIAFGIAPRLNAPGRLGDALLSLRLLLEKNLESAQKIAEALQQINARRQEIETKIFSEACSILEETLAADKRSLVLLAREGWNPGVLGIVAGRLVEKYHLPVILLALEEGMGKGSGRSSGDFDITRALKKCASLLLEYGGHRQACGLKVKEEHLPLLAEKLNRLAEDFFQEERPVQKIPVELVLEPEMITPRLAECLERLEPFGEGNPHPVFAGENWSLASVKEVGQDGRHLQLRLQVNNCFFRGISFGGKNNLPLCKLYRKINVLFSVSFDRWRGDDTLQLEVYDFFYSDEHREKELTVIDRRGIEEKRRFLSHLLNSGEKVVVFVNTVGRLQDLAKFFSRCEGIEFVHQGRFPRKKGLETFSSLVLYDLPLTGDKLVELCRLLRKNKQENRRVSVYLLYGVKDFRENLKLLRATVPSFSSLEQVYLSLQELSCGESISLKSAYGKLRKLLPFSVTGPLLEKSMIIFNEAACLHLEKETIFLPEETVKDYCSLLKHLSQTGSYREEKRKWEHAFTWQQFFLHSPGEEILYFLTSSSPGSLAELNEKDLQLKEENNEPSAVKKTFHQL